MDSQPTNWTRPVRHEEHGLYAHYRFNIVGQTGKSLKKRRGVPVLSLYEMQEKTCECRSSGDRFRSPKTTGRRRATEIGQRGSEEKGPGGELLKASEFQSGLKKKPKDCQRFRNT